MANPTPANAAEPASDYLSQSCTEFECKLCRLPLFTRKVGMKHSGLVASEPREPSEVGLEPPEQIWLYKDRSQTIPTDWMPFWSKTQHHETDILYGRARPIAAEQTDYCYAPGDEGAKYCGDPKSRHCTVLGDKAFWKSDAGHEHLVKCLRDDHFIHHPFVAAAPSEGWEARAGQRVVRMVQRASNTPDGELEVRARDIIREAHDSKEGS